MGDFPAVSCLCPTYGRYHLLRESVESFLRQDYQGKSELIILNDLPEQKLSLAHERVRVVNLSERCMSLGAKRNAVANLAAYDWLLTWGDDDIHLPWRISRLMNYCLRVDAKAMLEGQYYYLNGKTIKLVPYSPAGSLLVERELYFRVGGIPEMNSGEDSALNERIKRHSLLWHCEDLPPGFIYRWGTNHYHISGFGTDKTGALTSWEKAKLATEVRIERKHEPVGEVVIEPYWKEDYVALSQAVLR